MHSARTNSRTNIFDVGPRFGSTKLVAGAPHIRAFCECVGVCAIRAALLLAALLALLLIAARPAQAQTETVLYNFTGLSDGANPISSLTSDSAGNFYGTTTAGGTTQWGTVFEISPNGSGGWHETVLYNFCSLLDCTDGAYPYQSDLIFDSAGNLYGTTAEGGANGYGVNGVLGYGVVFKLTPGDTGWTETVLYNFAGGTDGYQPWSGLIMDSAGNLYGTTAYGGAGLGTVFELSPSGDGWTEQVIYDADANSNGIDAGLTMDAAGNIFGVAWWEVFELSPNGHGGWNSTVIHTFTGSPEDGSGAQGTPVLDQAGNLYGTTTEGGATNYGTVYELSPPTKRWQKGKWTERILHSFGGGNDGWLPFAAIVFDAAGNIYGTTFSGGVFELAAQVGKRWYKEKVLWTFSGADGSGPWGSLILDSAGNLYGTTCFGGSTGNGVVFEVTPGTTTTLKSSPNPSTHGQAVIFTATVTSNLGARPPDGETVSFMQGKTVLGTGTLSGGSASFTISTLAVGINWITAVYGGDLDFLGSKSNYKKQVVE